MIPQKSIYQTGRLMYVEILNDSLKCHGKDERWKATAKQ